MASWTSSQRRSSPICGRHPPPRTASHLTHQLLGARARSTEQEQPSPLPHWGAHPPPNNRKTRENGPAIIARRSPAILGAPFLSRHKAPDGPPRRPRLPSLRPPSPCRSPGTAPAPVPAAEAGRRAAMDVGSVDCVSLLDAAAPAAVDDASRGLGTLLAAARASYPKVATAGGVHELLECPVCTNSMFPPIHQVAARDSSSFSSS